jgi:hypothetical protein
MFTHEHSTAFFSKRASFEPIFVKFPCSQQLVNVESLGQNYFDSLLI